MFEKHGYKNWKSEDKGYFNDIHIHTNNYVREVQHEYTDVKLCQTNDKIVVHITETISTVKKEKLITYEVGIKSDLGDSWADLKLYSISKEDFDNIGVKEWEKKIIKILIASQL